jgi:hypothetical protein
MIESDTNYWMETIIFSVGLTHHFLQEIHGDKLGKIKYLWSSEEMIDDINLDIGCL